MGKGAAVDGIKEAEWVEGKVVTRVRVGGPHFPPRQPSHWFALFGVEWRAEGGDKKNPTFVCLCVHAHRRPSMGTNHHTKEGDGGNNDNDENDYDAGNQNNTNWRTIATITAKPYSKTTATTHNNSHSNNHSNAT